jgi:DnaJ-class molecular chaperone
MLTPEGRKMRPCHTCHGTGKVKSRDATGAERETPCPTCGGKGVVNSDRVFTK